MTTTTTGGYSGLQTTSSALMVFGLTQQAVGAYYGVLSNRYAAKSQALDLEHAATIAALNARQAEMDAQFALLAGRHEAGRVGLQYGQMKEQQVASQGASGTVVGVGSNAEVLASTELVKQLDLITIDANATRAANAARMRAVDERNRGRLGMVSAKNIRDTAGAVSPALAGGTALISGAGMIAGQWAAQQERRDFYRSRGSV